jgi:hypothetical protein
MAQRYHFVPAPDSKPSSRAELARLLTTYVWWHGHEWPAYETRAQTSNYITRMPWEVLVERGYAPEDLPRYSVTLPDGSILDVLVLARGDEAAQAALRSGLPEGSTFAKADRPFALPRHRQDASGWFGTMEAMGFVLHPKARAGSNDLLAALFPDRFKGGATTAKNYRDYRKRTHGITLETLVAGCPFREGVVVTLTLPGARYGVPVIVNASSAPEAADLIRQHLPPGTKISTKARHTMRLDQPSEKETPNAL